MLSQSVDSSVSLAEGRRHANANRRRGPAAASPQESDRYQTQRENLALIQTSRERERVEEQERGGEKGKSKVEGGREEQKRGLEGVKERTSEGGQAKGV